MNKQPHKLENSDFESVTSSLQDLSFANSVSISLCSSTISGSDSISSNISNASNDASEAKVCEKSGLCLDPNETSFRSFCPSKPHKGNDIRWDAIQYVKAKDGILGLGLGHFRLLKKLGCGDIGSVYLAELRGMGCLFAMKVMDKGMLAGRKKLLRAQTEREIMGLLDHPFGLSLFSFAVLKLKKPGLKQDGCKHEGSMQTGNLQTGSMHDGWIQYEEILQDGSALD